MTQQNRRTVVVLLAASLAAAKTLAAARAQGVGPPAAKFIPGDPPVLDYGEGVKVPCDKHAFFTLWEGSAFWLSFGFGISPSVEIARIRATKQAAGVMKFLLLTLAFAPQRLVKGDGNGWHKKDPAARDFVLGELVLPGSPSPAVSDAFLGGGNVEISPFWDWTTPGAGPTERSRNGESGANSPSWPPSNLQPAQRHAFASYIILKKDLSLADVRKRAAILQL